MNEYRDKKVIAALLQDIQAKARTLPQPIRLMEVCGTHTMTIHKYGLKTMLEEAGVEMTSGPGCPVCITPNEVHEAALDLLTGKENLILATFGDMTRVPTRRGSIQTAVPAPNSRMKIVYSPEESIDLALQNPEKEVIFFGVGFETTIPAIALTAQKASALSLKNYSILSALWVIPPPLRAIVESGTLKINGFLYPGHVSVIIGQKPYLFLADDYDIPGAIAGFEPADICLAISSVLDQMIRKESGVFIEYSRAVQPEGNSRALSLMEQVLEPKDAFWRGLGRIPRSGLKLKREYSAFDAELRYGLKIKGGSGDLPGCRCGEVLRGIMSPPDCPLFGKKCNPESPRGPCMVSYEGACLIHYKYGKPKKVAKRKL
jgi:hydrogenase expression/formation protein HypD